MMSLIALLALAQPAAGMKPARVETISPMRNASFNKGGTAKKRIQGGHPRVVEGHLVFDGAEDGDRQVDPQIAVGGGYVMHGTNNGFTLYNKSGEYVDGVPQKEFNNGIDPKMFFDLHNRVFAFDLWVYWDKEKVKPVNISVSETSNPTGAWNTYPVPAPGGVDGGGIGYSRKWIGYSFPGGSEETFVLKMADAKRGRPAKVYHFAGSLGHPVFTQDPVDDLLFVGLTDSDIVLTTVGDDGKGAPMVKKVVRAPHRFPKFGWPPASPQKGSDKRVASGDRNPKNLVVQNGCVWFSQAVDVGGRSGIQWNQFRLDGRLMQRGVLSHPENSFIQTTLAVNSREDVLIGFQEAGPQMFVSARCAMRLGKDPKGTLRPIVRIAEGQAATEGGPWGDYSGTVIDGDNKRDFWTVQSVANDKGRGSAVIARILAK